MTERRIYPLPNTVFPILPNTNTYDWNQSSGLNVLSTALATITRTWSLLKGSFNICSLKESGGKTKYKHSVIVAGYVQERIQEMKIKGWQWIISGIPTRWLLQTTACQMLSGKNVKGTNRLYTWIRPYHKTDYQKKQWKWTNL